METTEGKTDPGAAVIDAFTCNWSAELNYIFPPFSLIGRTLKKLKKDKGQADFVVPYWLTQLWFALILQMLTQRPLLLPKNKNLLSLLFAPNKAHPLAKNLILMACHLSGNTLETKNIQQERPSWRPATKKQYSTYFIRWQEFTRKCTIDPLLPSVNQVLDFLAELFDSGLQYSAVNTARSALSTILTVDNVPIGCHPLLKCFMKGEYEQRPTLPRYGRTWDIPVVFELLKSWSPLDSLSLERLTLKLAVLLALTTGTEMSLSVTQSVLCNRDILFLKNRVELQVKKLLKHSKPGVKMPKFVIPKSSDVNNCVVHVLYVYMEKNKAVNKDTNLFISFVKPHKNVGRSTIGRWIKSVMALAGIDVSVFSVHSTRADSVSKAQSKDLPLDITLGTAGWTNAKTFHKFYFRPSDSVPSFSTTVVN